MATGRQPGAAPHGILHQRMDAGPRLGTDERAGLHAALEARPDP